MSSEPLIVQAVYSFKATNNDELCFKKGDKITVTQKDEGWWEGTLGDKTGWFPSNYVKECKEVVPLPMSPVAQQRQYRAVVLKDLIDSERAHVTELQGLVKNFLKPLEKSNILTTDEYRQLTGNINDVVDTHQQLLDLIEECESKPSDEQRVGKLFLTWAPRIKAVHQAYCSMHPRAVCILDLHKDELATYMESCGAATPGLLVLTTGLSKPFRRLDKYSGMLQELERHVEINHPDRGDTQRSVAVYKDIAATCAATRRQKELELQVLTGPVRGWEGQSLAQLGDIIQMGSVNVGPQHQDRYLVLFPNTLLMLSVSHRMSAFIYEGKLPLTNITAIKLEDSETYRNAFEISGPLIEKIIVCCQTKEEATHWVDLLKQHTKGHVRSPPPPSLDCARQTSHLDQRGYSTRSSVLNFTYNFPLPYTPTYPPPSYAPASPYCTLTKSFYRLVKEKVITQRLLKTLLYLENLKVIDTSEVKRRHHKTECFIRTNTDLDSSSDSSSEEDSDDDGEEDEKNLLHRQDAVENESDNGTADESNSFGFIRYFNASEDGLESFIDHGAQIEQPNIPEIITSAEENVEPAKEKVTLAVINQTSGESASSFETTTRPYMACEDLVNIDESIEIDLLNTNRFIPTSRHSLPTKFVGNKFNKSSMTMVYIPHWSNSENNLAQKSTSRSSSKSDSDSDDTTTHSSCLDLPVNPMPVPDALMAEIFYNFEPELPHSESLESEKMEASSGTVINPPLMFRNDSLTASASMPNVSNEAEDIPHTLSHLSLQFANIGFKTHSINSDKPKRMSSAKESDLDNNSSRESIPEPPKINLVRISSKKRTKIDAPEKGHDCQFLEFEGGIGNESSAKDSINDSVLVSESRSEKNIERVKPPVLPKPKLKREKLRRESSNEIFLVLPELECGCLDENQKRSVWSEHSSRFERSASEEPKVVPQEDEMKGFCLNYGEHDPVSFEPKKVRLKQSKVLLQKDDTLKVNRRSRSEEPNYDSSYLDKIQSQNPEEIAVAKPFDKERNTPENVRLDVCKSNRSSSEKAHSDIRHRPEETFRLTRQGRVVLVEPEKVRLKQSTVLLQTVDDTQSRRFNSGEPNLNNEISRTENVNKNNTLSKQNVKKLLAQKDDTSSKRSSIEPKVGVLQGSEEVTKAKSLHTESTPVFLRRENMRLRRQSSHEEAGTVLPHSDTFNRFRRRSSHEEESPILPRRDKVRKTNSLRKCVSYHYLQLGNRKPSCTFAPYCRCCTEPCFSRRSSDSGMAGSCTLNSPDLALAHEDAVAYQDRNYSLTDMSNMYQRDGEFRNSEMEAREFEEQCRCTSPFGSTPRTSCQPSVTDNVLVETRDSSGASVTSSCSDMSPFPIPQPWESENQIHEKIMSVKSQQNLLKQQQSQRALPSSKSRSCNNIEMHTERPEQEVFRSGLYAHWWMKAKLPISVIKGIVEEKNSSTADLNAESEPERKSPKSKSPKPS